MDDRPNLGMATYPTEPVLDMARRVTSALHSRTSVTIVTVLKAISNGCGLIRHERHSDGTSLTMSEMKSVRVDVETLEIGRG